MVTNPGRWGAQSTSPAEATCPAQEAREGCGASAATGCGHHAPCACCRRCIGLLQPNAVSLDGLPLGLYTYRLNSQCHPCTAPRHACCSQQRKARPSHTEAAARAPTHVIPGGGGAVDLPTHTPAETHIRASTGSKPALPRCTRACSCNYDRQTQVHGGPLLTALRGRAHSTSVGHPALGPAVLCVNQLLTKITYKNTTCVQRTDSLALLMPGVALCGTQNSSKPEREGRGPPVEMGWKT